MSATQPTSTQDSHVVGLQPSLPRWLGQRWFAQPVPAELLSLFRIGIAAVLLLDQLTNMLPQMSMLYGEGSTGAPEIYDWLFSGVFWNWSVLAGIGDSQALQLAMWVWIAATIGLLLGWNTRFCAVVVWVLSISFANLNVSAVNAGDHIRGMMLLYLMLTPCGAAWSIDAWLRRRAGETRQALVSPWALRLVLVQFAFMYAASGICKASGDNWPNGDSLHYVLHDVTLTRFSWQQLWLPLWLTQVMTWSVLAWEILFPVLLFHRRTRILALWFGVSMHLGIFITMELGGFPLYVLAAYVPLLWEEHMVRRDTEPATDEAELALAS